MFQYFILFLSFWLLNELVAEKLDIKPIYCKNNTPAEKLWLQFFFKN